MSLPVADLLNPSSSRVAPTIHADQGLEAKDAPVAEPMKVDVDGAVDISVGLLAAAAQSESPINSLPLTNSHYQTLVSEDAAAGDAVINPVPQQYGLDGQNEREQDLSLDEDTLKAIADAKNEYSTRRPQKNEPSDSGAMSPPPEAPKPIIPKKRPAPSKGTPSSKKKNEPSSVKKPPPKKRKINQDDRSLTPTKSNNSRKMSHSATPAGSSPGAARSSPIPSEGGVSDGSEDGTVYCICRKPDDHTWMIACDGDCDDWFHGKCINIKQEDGDLIDKFFCPNCAEKEQGITTWKPMCRRPGCRKPARLKKGAASKYCSGECGVRFFRDMAEKNSEGTATAKKSTRKRKSGEQDKEALEDDTVDLGPLGGPIRLPEIKSLAYAAAGFDEFRRLGNSGVLTPPATASPDVERKTWLGENGMAASEDDTIGLTEEERSRLDAIAKRKSALRARRQLLKSREKFVVWAKERAAKQNAALKVKNLCGFDKRLSWSDEEFDQWMRSPEGQKAADINSLETLPDAPDDETEVKDDSEMHKHFCMDKRCKKHPEWQRLALHDVRFEEADVGDEMRKIDREEQDIKERLTMRLKVNTLGGGLADEANVVETVHDNVKTTVPKEEDPERRAATSTPLAGDDGDVMGEAAL